MLEPLAHLGRDPKTGGYLRDAWSKADLELREWFRGEAARRGLALREDRNGNLWAWWGDPSPERPGVVTGSHLDSVRQGGAYDGPLGVVSAFAALDLLRRRGVTPSVPVGVACFSDEEGARFGVPCVGSRLLTGVLPPERALALTDDDGDTLADVLKRAGREPHLLGRDDETLAAVGTFVELHVEQGRGLVTEGRPVGVAEAIWPHGRWRFDFRGRADHAGTTRLADRDDPMLPLARMVLAARESAGRRGVVATVGKLRVSPGNANAIPGLVSAWLDARGADEREVRALVAELSQDAEVREESWTPVVTFDPALRDRIARAAGGDTPAPILPTGAGHDAGILAAAGVPSAMLFVRNPTGVSHSPGEHAERADCEAGVVALADVLEELCR
ncbi:allantoate amidohydrolase [Nonomuraea gerenzanensis]|uniref:N-formylglutamate deformylase [alternative form] n=1 Tax=Nonomuraea gerenzanensis TaxID=93944 RepID=A0A1M4E2J2_9ACTN|nr:allantoate amidohydrolase [Nonomuraea gerenzanensis]UBU15243.1 allantoate amidohydrolase [Nonomuraea gerenzanensis]SBO92986.1 N-formylglutamate deformylase [alternative form] [Nonomuraea gerenzanensis]